MLWYLVTKAIQDNEVVQHRGMVQVIYKLVDNETTPILDDTYVSFCNQFLEETVSKEPFVSSLPIRRRAIHYCFNSPLMGKIFSLAQCSSTTYERLRIRNHFGTFWRKC